MAEILRIKIIPHCDALLWTASSSGCFTLLLLNRLIIFTLLKGLPNFFQCCPLVGKAFGNSSLLIGLNFFLWKMVWNIVPTKSRISLSMHYGLDTSCSLCSNSNDSLLHLFFFCHIARVIWINSLWPLDILPLHISSMFDWLNIILHPEMIGIPLVDTHFFQIFAMVACDHIWFSRNKA